jgi:hypothetical protein
MSGTALWRMTCAAWLHDLHGSPCEAAREQLLDGCLLLLQTADTAALLSCADAHAACQQVLGFGAAAASMQGSHSGQVRAAACALLAAGGSLAAAQQRADVVLRALALVDAVASHAHPQPQQCCAQPGVVAAADGELQLRAALHAWLRLHRACLEARLAAWGAAWPERRRLLAALLVPGQASAALQRLATLVMAAAPAAM